MRPQSSSKPAPGWALWRARPDGLDLARQGYNAFWASRALMAVTLGWLVGQWARYQELRLRPAAVFAPEVWLWLAGVLAGYTLSGLWKVGQLVHHHIIDPSPGRITWLSPLATYRNAVANFRAYDLPFPGFLEWFRAEPLWTIAFVGMMAVEVAAIAAAFRLRLQLFFWPALVAFHLANALLWHTIWWVAPFLITALLFPYYLLPGSPYRPAR